jgi:hypothetical protein
MKKFVDIAEAPKTVAFTFGRFNPPTIGHEKLCDAVKKANPSDYKIFASHTQNPKKDPLQYAKKIAYMKQSFPKHKNSIVVSKSREIFKILVELNNYDNLIMVVGSDRVAEFTRIINEYNGVKARHGFYEYKTVQVLSAGERDPDAEGATGMSASKMRAAAQDNDFNSFKQGTPLPDAPAKKLYFDVRKSMGIKEELDLNDPETLRDLYLSEQIWNVGELVTVNDNPYEIIRKGTNYITAIDETYKTHKFWLHEISMYEMSGTALKKISQEFKDKSKDITHGREFAFLSGLMKTINHRQLAKDLKSFITRHLAIKSDIIKILNKYLKPYEVTALTEGKAEDEAPKKTKQDKDIKDRDGTQPAKYYAKDTEGDAMAKSTKQARARHFAKYGDKDPDSDAAYKPAPGDKGGKTKPSKHTKKFKQMFGERDYKDEYKKFQSSPERIKYRAELVKYNRDKGTYGNGDDKDASHKDGKIVGFEDQNKNRGKSEKSRLKGSKRKTYTEAPRIPRKKGQPAGSDSHSDLYTDENPEGTIQGLGFKDVETAKSSVAKIEKSDRTHAHKIQAAVAMEQRAKEMGKKAEASIYRAYINKMKEKTKKMNEGLWDNIRKKKQRIKQGSGEKMRSKGEKGAPTSSQIKKAQEEAPDTSDAMKRYKSGKAGFTDIAHLKAKGLIKRADGTKKKSDKYEMTEEFKFYPDNLKDYIQIPPPLTNDAKEMETVRKILSTRTDKDIDSVANNDKDSFYSIKEYMKKMKVKFHENELNDIVQQAVPTINHFKNKFNRSRPFELDGNLDVLGSTTNKTPSYPSGHSTQAMIVALYVAQKFPEHRDGLIEAAKEVGLGRVKAGFHFLSDHVAGQMLGTKMFEQMNKEDYGQSLREYYLIGTPEYDEYLKKLTPGETVKEKLNQWDELDEDAEYQGKKVKLNNPVRGGNKKFYVYVKNDKGNIIKVSFGDSTGLSIKRDDPERRKAFRARHNCDQKKDKTTPGYWSCKFWEKGKSVTDLMKG